ncbi:restriction endonuclease subunit M [Clostridium sp. AF15-17LB]|nr:restriction endonuclease subunit M [Clostridium sp. AF15-17LB]
MDKEIIINYIKGQPIKVVTSIDLEKKKISYNGINQGRIIREITGEEEIVRAYLLTKLVNEYGYLPERIEIEHEYTAGRPHTISSRIDIIVRNSKGEAFLFIELKSPSEYIVIDKEKIIEEQLFKLAGMERTEGHEVKYLVLYTVNTLGKIINEECIIIDNKKFRTFADWELTRDSVNKLPERYGKAQKIPYIKASNKDLETNFTNETLERLQTDLHNVLWGGGGTDDNEVFSSLTNLILAKIQDEDEKEDGNIYDFQALTFEKDGDEEFETNDMLFERINNLYRRALGNKLYITDEKELKKSYVIDTKKFSLSKLKYTVQKLEGLSFVDGKNSLSGKDILGDFFEGIIRNGFKQSKGQFFTHINIVRFMLWSLQTDKLAIKRIKEDKEIPYMIDPSAGSGTFLIEYMKFITQNMKYRFRNELGTARAVKDKIESDWFYPNNRENKWAQTYIYGAEINFNLGTATKVNMILHGDGSTNIFVKDGLLPFAKYEKETAPNALKASDLDKYYQDKEINGQFDLILTNPPFSVELDNDTKKIVDKEFLFGNKKNSENLFVERWYQLLRENGRVAAVLPESVFDTSENKYIRLFIYKYFKVKAVISLPQLAFEPYTSTKTSILFAQKKTAKEIKMWNELWDDATKEYSKLKTRVLNIMDVIEGKKQKDKLKSIKNLSNEEEKKIILRMLGSYFEEKDLEMNVEQIIYKYAGEIKEVCSIDTDVPELFGYVNTWWVFNETVKKLSYDIYMAEVEDMGYKRTKRGEKWMPNDLYRIDKKGKVLVDDGIETSVLDDMRKISWE